MSFTSPRDVYLAAAARGVSFLGDFLAATALVLALQERGAGGTAVAAVLMASVLPTVVLAPLAGRVVDRVDSRALLVTVGLAQAACCVTMAFVSSTWLLVVLAMLLAAGLAFTGPTFGALTPEMAGPDGVGRAIAIMQTANAIGMLLGPALAGVLVGAFGLRLPLLVNAVTFLAVVAAGLLIRTRRKVSAAAAAEPAHAAWRIRSDRVLFGLMAMVGALILTVNTTMVVLVFFVRDTLGGSATHYGLAEAAWMAGLLVGGWLGAGLVRGDNALARTMILLHLATATVVTVAGVLPAIGWIFPLWLLGGTINGMENNILGVLAVRRVPTAVRGRYFARFGAVANGGNLIGYAVGGLLVGLFEPRQILVGCGLAGIVAVLGCAVPVWRVTTDPRRVRTKRAYRVGPDLVHGPGGGPLGSDVARHASMAQTVSGVAVPLR